MKKVLILSREYPPNVYGGAGVHVEFLSAALARLVDVEVRCFGDAHDAGGSGRPAVRGFEAPERELAGLDGKLRKALEPVAVDLRIAAAPTDADVVHCHTWYSMLAGVWVKKLHGIPLVLTAHSLEPLRPWKAEQLGRGYDLSSWIERVAFEEADAVVAVSNATRDEILECYDVDPERVRVIHNGIDAELFHKVDPAPVVEKYARKYGFSAARPYLLFVGRVTRQKGVVHLVRALEHVRSDVQAVLCAGAPDTPEIAAEMEEAVRRASARRPGVVWIPEMVAVRDLVSLYSGAAMFVCPSVYEPFGIINLEAMACQTPVVAARVGGIPEVVVDGETGILVEFEARAGGIEPRDLQGFARGLAAAIDRLAADPQLCRRMGEAGRRRVEERFSWTSVARRTLDLYERVTSAVAAGA
jgi:glycogen synthase